MGHSDSASQFPEEQTCVRLSPGLKVKTDDPVVVSGPTRLLSDTVRSSYEGDRLTFALLCLGQRGTDATHFISVARGHIPELTAHAVTLRHATRNVKRERQRQSEDGMRDAGAAGGQELPYVSRLDLR